MEFERVSLPFRWFASLEPGQAIAYIDVQIQVYPAYLPIYDIGYYAQPIYLYFLEGSPPRALPQRHRLSFHLNRCYPPPNSKPSGIYCWASNSQIHLSGAIELQS